MENFNLIFKENSILKPTIENQVAFHWIGDEKLFTVFTRLACFQYHK